MGMAIIEREPLPPEALLRGGAGTIESLVPDHDRILAPAECEQLAVDIARRGLWEGVELTPTESHTRAYALLYEDERIELRWFPPHEIDGMLDSGELREGKTLVALLKARRLEVVGDFRVRGGITTKVTVRLGA